ncbi:MAG: hypothetical protein ACLR23_17960 [Clostridia bacterium]
MRMILIQYRDNKVAMTGLVVFVLIFLACFILPILYPLDPSYQDVTQQNLPPGFSQQKVPRALRQNAKQIDAGAAFSIGIDQMEPYTCGHTDDKLKAVPEDLKPVYTGICRIEPCIGATGGRNSAHMGK